MLFFVVYLETFYVLAIYFTCWAISRALAFLNRRFRSSWHLLICILILFIIKKLNFLILLCSFSINPSVSLLIITNRWSFSSRSRNLVFLACNLHLYLLQLFCYHLKFVILFAVWAHFRVFLLFLRNRWSFKIQILHFWSFYDVTLRNFVSSYFVILNFVVSFVSYLACLRTLFWFRRLRGL